MDSDNLPEYQPIYPNYCEYCGRRLEYEKYETGGYDKYTGKEKTAQKFECPLYYNNSSTPGKNTRSNLHTSERLD